MLASVNNVHMCSCVRGCMLGSVMSLCVYVYVHMCMCICVCVYLSASFRVHCLHCVS